MKIRYVVLTVLMTVISISLVKASAQPIPFHTINPVQLDTGVLTGIGRGTFSSDGTKLIIAGSNMGLAFIYDVQSGKLLKELQRIPGDYVNYVNISYDGRYVIGSGLGNEATIWDAETGEIVQKLLHEKGEPGDGFERILGCALSPDGSKALTFSQSTWTSYLWDVATETVVKSYPNLPSGGWLEIFPDGKRGSFAEKQIVDLETGVILHEFSGNYVTLSPDFKVVFGIHGLNEQNGNGEVFIWDANTGVVINTYSINAPKGAVGFSPNQILVIQGESGNTLTLKKVLPSNALEQISTFSLPNGKEILTKPLFSPNGEYFYLFTADEGYIYKISNFLSGIGIHETGTF